MWNDSDLQHDVEKELAWEPSAHLKRINVTVKDGKVELFGHVDHYWEKCVAERAACRVLHVGSVVNTIHVSVPFDQIRADDDIALAAMGNLEWNCAVPATVEVQVQDACVTLSGNVEWQYQKDEAERALGPLKSITGINNKITVDPKSTLGEERGHIEEAFKRSALVDRSHIKAHVSQGIVSLRGTARSRAERDEAMRAAWSAPGVRNVEDHILIQHS